MKLTRLVGIGLIIILICVFASAAPKRKRASRKPKASIAALPNSFTEGDKRQLLQGISDAALLAELDRRLLSIYSLEELEREARLRKLR